PFSNSRSLCSLFSVRNVIYVYLTF
ncbi:hypothetical protein TrRE_jg13249, partial [Triparma retinervis]